MNNKSLKGRIIWADLKNINVYIDQKKILSDISINLNYGENTLLLGPNGSGKSTFLKLLNIPENPELITSYSLTPLFTLCSISLNRNPMCFLKSQIFMFSLFNNLNELSLDVTG